VSVSLNQSSVTLAAGATSQFAATVKNSSNTSVTWSVNNVTGGNSSVGTISATGLYTAPSQPGNYTVAATSVADTAASAKAAVAVGMLGAISPATALVLPKTTQQFTASVEGFSNTAVNWSVDQIAGGNSSVGTITSNGLYTAPAQNGPHTITAVSAADSSVTASASVTVTSLSISSSTTTLLSGTQLAFTATLPGVSNPTINWSATGGTISSNGATSAVYTAPSAYGTYTITATDASLSTTSTVTVLDFSISPTSATVAPSGTEDFSATLQGLSNDAVSWSVNGTPNGNASVGTITSSGVYTAPSGAGSYYVTATSTADPAFSLSATVVVTSSGPASVLTYHNDDARDGANLQELILTPSNVNSSKFGKLLAYPVDGQVYAQPLYVPQLSIAGGTYDVVFVETQNNSVYAFDADATSSQNAQTFWHINFGNAISLCDTGGPCPQVGILSTPVIDLSTNTMYLVAEGSPNAPTPFRLYALDITTGATTMGPVVINGSVSGTGGDSSGGNISLETSCYQRMGLALSPVTNSLYIAFGSCTHGWVFAYDKTNLAFQAVFNATPDGDGGGFWGGGAAPAIDDTTGDVYLLSGVDELTNGDPGIGDPVTNGYNDSFLRLDSSSLSIVQYFTPADNFTLAEWDADLGSGGNVLMPSPSNQPMMIGGGKDGNVFVVNQNDMGGYNPGGTNNVIQTVQVCTDGYNNIFSTPVYWNGSVYYHCNDNVIEAFSWNPSNTVAPLSTTPTAKGSVVYSKNHGATPSLSANGSANGIIWDIDNSGYTSDGTSTTPLVLHAYDATNLTELYNTTQAGSRDTAGYALKFTVPTIANGKVFVPTANELDVYGLLP
jgi:hypothetical protein